MTEGVFIAIEGIDGAGVTTQASILQEKLEDTLPLVNEDAASRSGPNTHLTKEPTDGPAGGQLRVALSERLELDPETLALFFAADRRDHVEQEIQPMLDDGYIVITDRYYLSSYAYQLEGADGDLEWLQQINKKSISPDLTILLDVDVKQSRRRREKDRLRRELYEDDRTLETVAEHYRDIANELKSAGENIEVVDANGDKSDVADHVFDHVAELLRTKGTLTT